MLKRKLIFVVSTDPRVRRLIRFTLENAGYQVMEIIAPDLIHEIEYRHPSAVLIDYAVGDVNATQLCRRIRQSRLSSNTVVVFLTAGDGSADTAPAFNAGADDCISSIHVRSELAVRINALLRPMTRAYPSEMPDPTVCIGDIELDGAAMRVSVRGKELPTTVLEFRLLQHFIRHPGRIFSRDQLLDAVWGDARFVTPRTVDACIRRLRRKFEQHRPETSYLRTVRGIGYSFNPGTQTDDADVDSETDREPDLAMGSVTKKNSSAFLPGSLQNS